MLLNDSQKAYFEKRTANLPCLRLSQSIVTEDSADIVQNADLQESMEMFVVLCTFTEGDEFAGLAEQLGQRLESAGSLRRGTEAMNSGRMLPSHTSQPGSSGKLSIFGLRKCLKRSMLFSKSRTLGLTRPQSCHHIVLHTRMCSRLSSRRSRSSVLRQIKSKLTTNPKYRPT